jgi:5-(carboxyamino)imidazole ribonucleotide mutase
MFLPGDLNFWTTSLMNRLLKPVRSHVIGCSQGEQPCTVFGGKTFDYTFIIYNLQSPLRHCRFARRSSGISVSDSCGTFLFVILHFLKESGFELMTAKVGVIMGSKSDWDTMKLACDVLEELDIPYEKKVVSAHRTPDLMFEYAETAAQRGLKVIIAGAGGAAHLPGMVAAKTILPVIGVPVKSSNLNGLDSLLSIVQMPGGIPVATVAIGNAGGTNAGLLAAQMLGAFDPEIQARVEERRERIKQEVLESSETL